ncbi:hypothetical protein [Micromonospora sp. A202]|uniref:hypothetical protein n=1 Tax=Micromonospora sp. A202 TaxID=2572899 RepID=UPI001152E24A|nr:hypothetical protein [Micromonospora sp. A202]
MAHSTSPLDGWLPSSATSGPDCCSTANDRGEQPGRTGLPGVHRLRVVLLALVVFAGTGAGGHAPPWTRLVVVATAVAVPAAIALQYGWPAVRTLLGLPSRPRLRGGSVSAPGPARPE